VIPDPSPSTLRAADCRSNRAFRPAARAPRVATGSVCHQPHTYTVTRRPSVWPRTSGRPTSGARRRIALRASDACV